MEFWGQILIAVVPAIISGFVAYYKATSNAKVEIHKVEKNAETEIARIEKDYEGKINELEKKSEADLNYYKGKLEADSKKDQDDFMNEMTAEFTKEFMTDLFGGNVDTDQIEKINEMTKKMENGN